MNEKKDPDDLDAAIISADDTGMVANQHLIVEEEILADIPPPEQTPGTEPG